MYCMARAKSGLDRRQPSCVPDDDRIASPEVVRSLGSSLYSHHARLANSGQSGGQWDGETSAHRVEGVSEVEEKDSVAVCPGFDGQRSHGVDTYLIPTFEEA